MNKSSSLLLHLHLHLLHFLIMNKSSYFKKKKKEEGNFQKRPWDYGHWARTSQVAFQKKKKIINQNFQFLQKIQGYQIFQKKKKKSSIKIFNSFKKFKFSKFKKKKKKNLHYILLQEQKAMIFFHIFQWCNIKSTVHPQHSSKHGICPKLGAFARYANFFSMNNSVTN